MAAGLPALKPLFNWALETARSISHTQRSRSKFSGTGYPNSQKLHSSQNSTSRQGTEVHLENLSGKWESQRVSGNTYDVEAAAGNKRSGSMVKTTKWVAYGNATTKQETQANGSQEMILPLQNPEMGDIVKTTVVKVS